MSTVLPPKSSSAPEPIPPLEAGDRLTREEFERRYEAMSEVKKAELIKGVVYMGSPVRHERHGKQQSFLIGWLAYYAAWTPGVQSSDNATVKLSFEDEPQPDGLLFILPKFGGQCRIDDAGYILGAPELNAEIAASSVSYDLHDKLDAYRQHGVREYLVWRVQDNSIDWFVLVGGKYDRLSLSPGGWYRSQVFPGLWLDPQALLVEDLARVYQVLQQGISSTEHQCFVEDLAKRRPTPGEASP